VSNFLGSNFLGSGFLGFGASFMLDFVLVSLILVVPVVLLGIFFAKNKSYKKHSRVMFLLSFVLLVVVTLFEVDIRLHDGIDGIAKAAGKESNVQTPFFVILLYVHLFFALSCCVLWSGTVWGAWKNFYWKEPAPNSYGAIHRKRVWISLFFLLAVVITGIMVYYFAFMV
jgi:uncharacterized membrane protein YozB (DUF420 family)